MRVGADAEVEISVPGGEKIAGRTLASFSCAGDSRHLSGSQPSGHFPGLYYEEVMPGGMAYVDAVGRYDSVVALDKVTDIGGNQRIRSPGDRSVDNATVLQIEAWGKSRQIVRIVDRHSGVSKFGIAPPPSTTCGKSPDGPRREMASMRDMNQLAESRLAPFLVRTSNNLDSMAWETTN